MKSLLRLALRSWKGQKLQHLWWWTWGGIFIGMVGALCSFTGVSAEDSSTWRAIIGVLEVQILAFIVLVLGSCLRLWAHRNILADVSIKDEPGVKVRIVIGDLLQLGDKGRGVIVVGMNREWQCRLTSEGGTIAPNSLQGQVTTKWFHGSGSLESALRERREEGGLGEDALEAANLGRTARLEVDGKSVIWVTMSKWDAETGAYRTTVPELEQAMGGLWEGLRGCHNFDEDVFCPIVGAKFGKIQEASPTSLLKRHIRSFVSATKEQRIVKTMTFVIRDTDLEEVEMDDLRDFVFSECRREALKEYPIEQEGTGKDGKALDQVDKEDEIEQQSRDLAVAMMELSELREGNREYQELEDRIVGRVEKVLTGTMRILFADERAIPVQLYARNIESAKECLNWQRART